MQANGGEDALEKNIKKLIAGRIDAIIENNYVFNYKINQLGLAGDFKNAGEAIQPDKAYIAFSPANPKSKEYAEILSKGMEELRKSGELTTIMKKYGLQDWK